MSTDQLLDRDWPAHVELVRPWRQKVARGTKIDRKLREIAIALPPKISDADYPMPRALSAMVNASAGDLRNLDLIHGRTLQGLNSLQLRTESVDSSKIENIEASLADYGRAMLGTGANASAMVMASATRAMNRLISTVETERKFTVETLLAAHRDLFWNQAGERSRAGQFRTSQNWVGGSDYSPATALHVPPPPETVASYMEDLVAFANRDDVPILAQAAIMHAQFESIHPFIDGNGRIGRALIHAAIRRRRGTRHLVVPIASALVAHRERYFGALNDYRAGRAHTIVAMLASATSIATAQSRGVATELEALEETWRSRVTLAKSGSSAGRLLDLVSEEPIMTASLASQRLGISVEEIEPAIDLLKDHGVLARARRSRRNPVWIAPEVLDLVTQLRARILDRSQDLQDHA